MRGVLAQFSPSIAAWQTVFSARTAHSTRSSQLERATGSKREDEKGGLERVASHLVAAGEGETARLMRALQPVLAETTHEVFRDDTPAERENRVLPARAN